MYVRQMRNGDEDWLLNQFDRLGLEDPAFRSRDYVLAIDNDGGEFCGFGRVYRYSDDEAHVRIANVVVFEGCDEGRTRSLIYEELFKKALEYECRTAYVVATDAPNVPYDFEACEPDEEPTGFEVSLEDDEHLFKADVYTALDKKTEEEKLQELADEFGYDEDTTTKYSIE